MANRKTKKEEKIYYKLKVLDWGMSYSFGVMEDFLQNFLNKKISKDSSLSIHCEIKSPKIKNVTSAQIVISQSLWMEKHLKEDTLDDLIDKIGQMQKPRCEPKITFSVLLPTLLQNNIFLSVAFNKIEHISIYADRLRYGKGDIYNISFDTDKS